MKIPINTNTFHTRKAERTLEYETNIKGWRLRNCIACNGSGKYDHNGNPDCSSCSGTGLERYKPNCLSSIESLIGQTLVAEISDTFDIFIYVRSKRDIIYQYVRSKRDIIYQSDDNFKPVKLPRRRATIKSDYDSDIKQEDWFFKDSSGSRYFLNQFKPLLK